MTYRDAERARDKFAKLYLGKHGINAAGIGKEKGSITAEGEFVVRVFVEGNKPNIKLPDEIDGVKIIYDWNVGKFIAHSDN